MLHSGFDSVCRFLREPVAQTPWGDWRGFWLKQIFDEAYLVCYFLPLVPILLLWPRRSLRVGIVLTGLAFCAYVFGALYTVFWLATCLAFYGLSEKFAARLEKPYRPPWGPALAAGALIGGWYLLTRALRALPLPAVWNEWVYWHLPGLLPLGARSWLWEPYWSGVGVRPGLEGGAVPALCDAAFRNPHWIGTAFLTIRLWHYFMELRRGTIPRERRGPLHFLAWLCYAPLLIQGPMERYSEFQDQTDAAPERRSWRNVPPAFARIGLGLLKALLSLWYLRPTLWLLTGPERLYYNHPEKIESYALLYFGVYLDIFRLYLEFSGYCDVAIGIGRLLGYRTTENFNWPWLATSLRDLWKRWHITLSAALRDYVYIPLGGNRRHVTLNLCLTFIICGLWHMPNPRMAMWGLVMGLMVAVNQHWSQWMKRLDEMPAGRWAAVRRAGLKLRPLPTVLAWALTIHCFVMSMLLFFGGTGAFRVAWELLRRPLTGLVEWIRIF